MYTIKHIIHPYDLVGHPTYILDVMNHMYEKMPYNDDYIMRFVVSERMYKELEHCDYYFPPAFDKYGFRTNTVGTIYYHDIKVLIDRDLDEGEIRLIYNNGVCAQLLLEYRRDDMFEHLEWTSTIDEPILQPQYLDCKADTFSRVIRNALEPSIEKVIFNKPATIVFWTDGTKTVVKCGDGDVWDEEKGLAMAICKKLIGLKEFYKQYNKATKEVEDLDI